jgi:hypothetical protein
MRRAIMEDLELERIEKGAIKWWLSEVVQEFLDSRSKKRLSKKRRDMMQWKYQMWREQQFTPISRNGRPIKKIP